MNKKLLIIPFIIPILLTACQKNNNDNNQEDKPSFVRVEDERTLTTQEYTTNNIIAVDKFGRVTTAGDLRKEDKKVGVFYHVWHGTHNTGIFDITQLLEGDPDSLWDPNGNAASPLKAFHYWGQPLYGYYHSSDPWVITRHCESFTMAGVDYLVYDLTNTVIYTDAINSIFAVFDKYQKQGFNVPKVAFYTNSASGETMKRCYNLFYKNDQYSNLWYSMDGQHPLIIGQVDDLYRVCSAEEYEEISNFFHIRESQWPDATKFNKREGFPWMDWDYPQLNYSGTMSVSLAQHPGMKMSQGAGTNHGRGFNYTTYQNDEASCEEGTNVEGQWKTVFDNYDKVNNVFVTGWNEWIAQKMADGTGSVFFVDTFNEPYSRDMEMMKGGYGDNFYLQFTRNIKKYAFTEPVHYVYNTNTMNIHDFDISKWEGIKAVYQDFAGDALERDFYRADRVEKYYDSSNRNDIVKTYVTHDSKNLYVRVETLDDITEPSVNDTAWMNVMISLGENDNTFNSFSYIINRSRNNNKATVEKLSSSFAPSKVGECDFDYQGNVIQYSIPLSLINRDAENFQVGIKVCDNIQEQNDIQDYYVSGDCAPIGRLCYSYGY